ncbi:hypothetical protein NUSPORA_00602 [Nucleospora cyclopteri]
MYTVFMERYKKLAVQKIAGCLNNYQLLQPQAVSQLTAGLQEKSTRVETMKRIISMQQQGYDLSVLHTEVLKQIDTTSEEFKFLSNIYMRTNFINRPGSQLMCVNTFLKDFCDRNPNIQRMAIIEAINLSDEVIVKSYVRSLMRMLNSESVDLKSTVVISLATLYKKNRTLFLESGFTDKLSSLLTDSNDKVVISTLILINFLERYENFINLNDLLELSKSFLVQNNVQGLRLICNVLKSKQINESYKKYLEQLLLYGDVCIFYSVSAILLRFDDNNVKKTIFDCAISFMNLRKEHQYNILLFIKENLTDLDYNTYHFSIFEDDFEAIKKLKLQLLFNKLDKIAVEEIKGLINRQELIPDIFNGSILKKIYFPGILNFITKIKATEILVVCLKNLELLKSNDKLYLLWRADLNEFLQRLTPEPHMIPVYLEVTSSICTSIPPFIFKIKENHLLLLRFYLNCYWNGIISRDHCINYIKNKRRDVMELKIAKVIEQNLEFAIPDDILSFNFTLKDKKAVETVDFMIVDKPVENENFHDKLKKRKAIKFKERAIKLPFNIETEDLKCKIYFEGAKLILDVFKIMNEQSVFIKVEESMTEQKILTEGKKEIYSISLKDVEKAIEIYYSENLYIINLNLNDFISPYEISMDQFSKEFSEIENYMIVENFHSENIFAVSENTFSFELLGFKLLGKTFGNQIILKGEQNALEAIKNKGIINN